MLLIWGSEECAICWVAACSHKGGLEMLHAVDAERSCSTRELLGCTNAGHRMVSTPSKDHFVLLPAPEHVCLVGVLLVPCTCAAARIDGNLGYVCSRNKWPISTPAPSSASAAGICNLNLSVNLEAKGSKTPCVFEAPPHPMVVFWIPCVPGRYTTMNSPGTSRPGKGGGCGVWGFLGVWSCGV